MKTKILEIICSDKTDEKKFEELYPLFLATPYHNKGLAFRLNSQRVNKTTFSILVNELKKIYKISDIEIFKFKNQADEKVIELEEEWTLEDELKSLEFNLELGHFVTGKRNIPKEYHTKGKAVDYLNSLYEDSNEDSDGAEDDEEQKGFRDEFPFLNDKDCPEELKILAADKITAFTKVSEGRKTLKAVADKEIEMTEEEIQALTKEITEADEENALITDEFYHYLKTKTILGNHPIFLDRKIREKVEKMTGEEKLKRFDALKKGISRDKKALETADESKKGNIENRLAKKEAELNFIKKLTQ